MNPGIVALFGGAGETGQSGRLLHERLFRGLTAPVRVAVLETPAGFELNSADVAGRIAEFFRTHLQNFHPQVSVVPARRRGSADGPDNPDILGPLREAGLIFMGPGSPTYAARHLAGTLAWHTLQARHRLGAALSFSSAGTIAVGAYALPVYEIYKAGEDLHWQPGLDLLGPFGLKLVFVPHWSSPVGEAPVDISRCYMGRERMDGLLSLLPADVPVVGIDEHTALLVDLAGSSCSVFGEGAVTLVRAGREETRSPGSVIPFEELCAVRLPASDTGISPGVQQQGLELSGDEDGALTAEAAALFQQREHARRQNDWPAADALRARLADLGYQVTDSPAGSRWKRSRA
jgi:cyanophycinase-like exopeptidase